MMKHSVCYFRVISLSCSKVQLLQQHAATRAAKMTAKEWNSVSTVPIIWHKASGFQMYFKDSSSWFVLLCFYTACDVSPHKTLVTAETFRITQWLKMTVSIMGENKSLLYNILFNSGTGWQRLKIPFACVPVRYQQLTDHRENNCYVKPVVVMKYLKQAK